MRFLFYLPACQKLKRTIDIRGNNETEKEAFLNIIDVTFLKSMLAMYHYFKGAYSDTAIPFLGMYSKELIRCTKCVCKNGHWRVSIVWKY